MINDIDRQFLACVGIRFDDDILARARTPQPLPLSQLREPREPQEPLEGHGIVEAALHFGFGRLAQFGIFDA